MKNFTNNEIVALLHLADGEQHNDAPASITNPQYYTALKSLNDCGMVYAAFIEGGEAEAAMLTMAGQAAVDDIKLEQKRTLRKILKEKDLTLDQYDLLSLAAKGSVDYNNNSVLANSDTEQGFRNIVFLPLEQKNLLYIGLSRYQYTEIIISRLGRQLIEEIEDELYNQLANNEGNINQGDGLRVNQNPKPITPIKIGSRKKNIVIFALMSLFRIRAFDTGLNRDEAVDYILNILGEKEKNNVSQAISTIFNRSINKTPEAFIEDLVDGFRKELNDALAEEMRKKNEKK